MNLTTHLNSSVPHYLTVPLLAVFTVDYTLWPFLTNITTNVTTTLNRTSAGEVVDNTGKVLRCYEEVLPVFQELEMKKIKIGLINRAENSTIIERLIYLFDWGKYINFVEVNPGSVLKHFLRLRMMSRIQHHRMIFFDSSLENMERANFLKVFGYLIEGSMTLKALGDGLKQYRLKALDNPNLDEC